MPNEIDIAQIVSAWLAGSLDSPDRNRHVAASEGEASASLRLNYVGADGKNHTLHLAATIRAGKPVIVALVAHFARTAEIAHSLAEMTRVSAWQRVEAERTERELRQLGRGLRRSDN